MQLLCDHAALVAPALADALPTADAAMHRIIARVLGHAGAGYEPPLGALLTSPDEQAVRESFRSLARIGTPRAAALVAAQVDKGRGWLGGAAEQTLLALSHRTKPIVRSASCWPAASSCCAIRRSRDACSIAPPSKGRPTWPRSSRRSCRCAIASGARR